MPIVSHDGRIASVSLETSAEVRQLQPITAKRLRPFLEQCRYRRGLVRSDFSYADQKTAPLVAFAHRPTDARSACIVVLDAGPDPRSQLADVRQIGAPVTFLCTGETLEWWTQEATGPRRFQPPIPAEHVPRFFRENQEQLSPDSVYRAKTWGRFDTEFQLSFVDRGLMPLVEGEIGQRLEELIVRNVSLLKNRMQWKTIDTSRGDWLLKSVFWLVSAKILADKEVAEFGDVDLTDIDTVFDGL